MEIRKVMTRQQAVFSERPLTSLLHGWRLYRIYTNWWRRASNRRRVSKKAD